MSESEKIRRQNYKKNRKKWLLVQATVILLVALAVIASSVTYYNLNKTYYIDYTERGAIDYKVGLKPNEFYDEEWQESGQSYVASLIDKVSADFKYELDMEAKNVDYEYSYRIDAQLEIIDESTDIAIFDPIYEIKPEKSVKVSSNNKLNISEAVLIDYGAYNDVATKFIETYNLSNMKSTLIVRMHIDVTGSSDEFENNAENEYAIALNIPLTTRTLSIEMTSSVPNGESKVLAYNNDINRDLFKNAAIALSVAEFILVLIFIAFVYLTRNEDINYGIKVRKLVSAYKSYIQKINNGFDTTGYQILMVDTFVEMLGIRDTIQSPVLMSENEDKTCTRFLIPTNTKILYVFEIKVEDYDKIYGEKNEDATQTVADEAKKIVDEVADSVSEDGTSENIAGQSVTVNEESLVLEAESELSEKKDEAADEECDGESVCEAVEPIIQEPDASETEPEISNDLIQNEVANADEFASQSIENADVVRRINGVIVHVRYRTSYMSRLIQSEPPIQDYYNAVKNYLLSFKGVKARTSFNFESFNKGRVQCAKLNVKGSTFQVYLALNPKEYNANKYYFTDVSEKPKLDQVPMLLKVKSDRALKYVFELIDEMMDKLGIIGGEIPSVDYRLPYETTDALIDKGLIKLILPEGMTIDENTVIEKVNVGELLKDAKPKQEDVSEAIEESVIEEAMAAPDIKLEEVDYVDEVDEAYEGTEEKPGVEVVGVVWPERPTRNKIYRYDPDGEVLEDGDVVLVPTRDAAKGKDVVRKAAIAHGNHKVDPETLHHPLKKIIRIVKRRIEAALSED